MTTPVVAARSDRARFIDVAAIVSRGGPSDLALERNGQGGNITQVTSPSGRWIRINYDVGDRITQAMDDSGRTVNYYYDGLDRLSMVNSPFSTVYTYDANNRMTAITDARNIVYLTNTYDACPGPSPR